MFVDSAVLYNCYYFHEQYWKNVIQNEAVTNNWCENRCKAADTEYKFSGTISDVCYCRKTTPNPSFSYQYSDDECTRNCPGSPSERCGRDFFRITVSRIDRTTEIVTVTNTQAATATNVSIRDTTTADFMNTITSDTPLAIATKSKLHTARELSENANYDISPVMTETSTQATAGLSTETMSVTNTQATSTTSASIRKTTTSDFMNMITSNTFPATITQSMPSSTQESFSTTSADANTAISTLLTETSTQATRANGEWSSWKFCEVNCVREDTTEGIQRRWRKCNGAKCSGTDIEERPCSKPGICKGMRPRKLLCKCPKRLINTKWHFLDGKNKTNSEVKKIILEDINKNIKSESTVDKKTVSREVRKKTSSVNKRKSAQSIGWGCIVFLVLPIVFLIAIDILNCCIHFRTYLGRRKRNKIRAIYDIQDQSDSSKPLQENVSITEKYYASRCGNNFHPDEMKRETYQRRREDQNSRMEWMQYI